MKVLLVGNYAADQQHSILGFASSLLSGLCEKQVEARLIAPNQIAGKVGKYSPSLGKWFTYADKFLLFPPELRKAICWADVVHICDQAGAIYTRYLKGVPHVVTCNDLLAVKSARGEIQDWNTGWTGRIYQKLILNGLVRARHIVCISETTRQDVLRISGRAASNTTVIYDGLLHPFSPMSNTESIACLKPLGVHEHQAFLLHVGSNPVYKNRFGVLKIYRALPHVIRARVKMVMAGKPLLPEMRQFITNHNLTDSVIELTGLTNEQLRALYSRATALIFPSLYEGFGLPIIEAQACGCPVYTSNRAPMTEVGGTAAVYFDPAEPEQAARIIADSIDTREGPIAAGFENVKRFTTKRMIEDYYQLYQTLIAGTPRQ